VKPVPKDDNGYALIDRGTELFTHRISGLGTEPAPIALATDFKEVMFHMESGEEVLHVRGTVEGSSTAKLTREGYSWTLPLTVSDGAIIAYVAAPSSTVNVSIFAWR
jgi:hypothetical protein